jgi:hypothetical protein
MELLLTRRKSKNGTTLGLLDIDGVFQCYTCEDETRHDRTKVYGKTAIPAGTYKIIITHSPRFKRFLPLLLNVPGFEGVRIHTGNSNADTEGCILVGNDVNVAGDRVLDSAAAFNSLFDKLQSAQDRKEPITIKIQQVE